jgi:endonuclease-3
MSRLMQESFDFAAEDLTFIRHSLTTSFGRLVPFERREPTWQLARSLIGSQTYDRIAEPALEELKRRWPEPRALAAAAPGAVERAIQQVNHARDKAVRLVAAFRLIERDVPDHDLSFLRAWPVYLAVAWLEQLPGVGPEVAAATLNASTLEMPVFIVDSHVHRILLRFGFIGPRASACEGRDAVTAAAAGRLDAHDLLELFALMKRLGQTLCRPFGALCGSCPLADRCGKRTALGRPAGANAQDRISQSRAVRAAGPAPTHACLRPTSPAPAFP